MKAVILVAGVASRLRPLTETTPKCLLTVGPETFLGRMLTGLRAAGVREYVIVTGYLEHRVRTFIAESFPDLDVTYIHNPVFETTNNIYSLWLARDAVRGEGMVLLDGDILFDPRILDRLFASTSPAALAVRTAGDLGEEEIKVEVDAARKILSIGKHVPTRRAYGESIGIELFGPAAVEGLFRALERKVVAEGAVNVFYEAAFQDWIDDGGAFEAVDIGALAAMEIDTYEDYCRAEQEILPFLPPLKP